MSERGWRGTIDIGWVESNFVIGQTVHGVYMQRSSNTQKASESIALLHLANSMYLILIHFKTVVFRGENKYPSH